MEISASMCWTDGVQELSRMRDLYVLIVSKPIPTLTLNYSFMELPWKETG